MSATTERTSAERTTLVTSCVVLAAVIALILSQLRAPLAPAAPVAAVDGVTQVGGLHHVAVTVINEGGATAANVQVAAELVIGSESSAADQSIDFLARSQQVDLVFVFEDDPAAGDLTVVVTGFTVP